MSPRKKSTSSTNSSCTSSGSTSTSGSSSDSDSNSSSSDSDSSSSQGDRRRSSSASNSTPNESKAPPTSKKENSNKNANDKAENGKRSPATPNSKGNKSTNASKGQQQKVTRKPPIYSSEDETPQTKAQQAEAKRIQNEIKKKTLASQAMKQPKSTPLANVPPTGGKAPPSVVKQHQQMNKSLAAKNAIARNNSGKSAANSQLKSIFSPVNSSESDDGATKKQNSTKTQPAQRGRPKKVVEKPPEKSSESSTGTSTDSTSSSGGSDSESSADSSPPTKKKQTARSTNKQSKNSTSNSKLDSKEQGNSESEAELKPVTRKLTRSSNTRKSKHLTAIFNPTKASDPSESETESKRAQSKSPVKRTKGNAKNSKHNSKVNVNLPKKAIAIVTEERRCPVDGCDSMGHLAGSSEKHFTQEACPLFHNVSLEETKSRRLERVQHEEERKKAAILFDPSSNVTTIEQKAYLMKIREMRANFVPTPSVPLRQQHHNSNQLDKDDGKQRQPNLKGYVTEYDLKLFEEAQAVASEKIEADLLKWPPERGTKYITMGRHNMEVWYQSPYPDDVARLPKLYLCEFCLGYQKSEITMKRHAAKCVWRHPPGDEIYRKGKLGVWQVDGKRQKQYCQHLCLLAKFFLDHKTLYYDVEPFLFYVMTSADSEGCHTIGYFSKEKNSFLNYNVSCILTLPPYQRKGYGRLLIDFSYLLTRVEGKIGSPEKPLSDLGLISYRSYWKDVLLDYLCNRTGTSLCIKDVSQEMAINSYDIVSTLQALGMMKYWKGKHIILKKQDVLEEYTERVKRRGTVLKIDAACLRWTPFVAPAPATSS